MEIRLPIPKQCLPATYGRVNASFNGTDIEGLESGRLTVNDVTWFSGGVTRNAKLVGTWF